MADDEQTPKKRDIGEDLEELEAIAENLVDLGQEEMVRDIAEFFRTRSLVISYADNDAATDPDNWRERGDDIMRKMKRRVGVPVDEEGADGE